MSFFDKLFKKEIPQNPEGLFTITVTDKFIKVEHPQRKAEQVLWGNIQHIKIINTDSGPFLPDIWLALFGIDDGCLIPLGAKGYEQVYDIVSKYEGFNFESYIESMSCTDNSEFDLWSLK